tara:strand:+ start:6950 stop:7093 length:144 start_codon:yes stop_codon:yes gene_type:complete
MAYAGLKNPVGIFQNYNSVKFVKFIMADVRFSSPLEGEDYGDLAPEL